MASPTSVADFQEHYAPKAQSCVLGYKLTTPKPIWRMGSRTIGSNYMTKPAGQHKGATAVCSTRKLGSICFNPRAVVENTATCMLAAASTQESELLVEDAYMQDQNGAAGVEFNLSDERKIDGDAFPEIAGEEDRASERSLEREARATEVISDDEATEGEYDEEEDDLDEVVESDEGDVRTLCEEGFADHRPSGVFFTPVFTQRDSQLRFEMQPIPAMSVSGGVLQDDEHTLSEMAARDDCSDDWREPDDGPYDESDHDDGHDDWRDADDGPYAFDSDGPQDDEQDEEPYQDEYY